MKKSAQSTFHEDFEVTEKSPNKQKYIFRQNRTKAIPETLKLVIDRNQYPVIDYSAYGISIDNPDYSSQKEELEQIPLIHFGVEAAILKLKRVRVEKNADRTIVAYEIFDEPISYQKLDAIRKAKFIIDSHRAQLQNDAEVPSEIKLVVYEIHDILMKLKQHVEDAEREFMPTDRRSIYEFEDTLVFQVAEHLGQILPGVYDRFVNVLEKQSPEQKAHSLNFLHESLTSLFHAAPFAERAYTKPLGYAGDYEMMNLIYRQENVGGTLFARCLHRFCIDVPAAQAVRNRADYLVSKVLSVFGQNNEVGDFRVLSVACGPSREWQILVPQLANAPRHVKVDLLDQDTNALECAQFELRGLTQKHENQVEFRFLNWAIKNVITRGLEDNEYDLIYSAGLFDYFSDSVAVAAARKLYSHLKPGGTLVIGNFDTSNPSKNIMDLVFDWPLIYRSEQDLINLYSGIGQTVIVEKEPLGINLFCVLTKDR